MYKPNKRVVLGMLVLGVLGLAFGIWVLLHPASMFVQPWRAARAEAPVKGVLFGPYPVEADFVELRERGVTTIISLLEPGVPYEKVLLEKERALAGRYGMTVRNFPMGSILGQTFGADYARNSKAAAEAALQAQGVAYIHCYLGVHRARNVQRYLAEYAKVRAQAYAGTEATGDAAAEDRATRLFGEGRFEESLAALAGVAAKGPRMLRLQGWSLYRLQRFDEADASFRQALARDPGNPDTRIGLAYGDLARGRLEQAEAAFSSLRRQVPDDASVVEGLANVYYRQARWKDAEATFVEAVRRNPGNEENRRMLERVRSFLTPG